MAVRCMDYGHDSHEYEDTSSELWEIFVSTDEILTSELRDILPSMNIFLLKFQRTKAFTLLR